MSIEIIIRSITNDGFQFRPRDWVERITSTLISYTQQKIPLKARPCTIDGEKCFIINSVLAKQNPHAYDFVMQFAKSNNLNIKKCHSHVSVYSVWEEFEDFEELEQFEEIEELEQFEKFDQLEKRDEVIELTDRENLISC